MENCNQLFRTTVFGGFNKDDVIDYIEKTKNEFYSYRKQVEETIAALNKKIRDLESIGLQMPIEEEPQKFEIHDTSSKASDQIMSSVTEINEATELLRKTADLLCTSLGDFIEQITQNSVPVTLTADTVSTEETVQDTQSSAPETKAEISNKKSENESFFADILTHATPQEKEQPKKEASSSILDGIFSSALI